MTIIVIDTPRLDADKPSEAPRLDASRATDAEIKAEALWRLDQIRGLLVKLVETGGGSLEPPVMSSDGWSVTWRGRTCQLRSGILGKILGLLIDADGQAVPVRRLGVAGWENQCIDASTLSTAISRLRGRLAGAGMPGLASSIVWDDRREGYTLRRCDSV
jgi:hypothetical protein